MIVCIHIPSRGRPAQLRDTVARWTDAVQDKENTFILVSLDADDWSDHKEAYQALNDTPALVVVEKSSCKIEAINRDLDCQPWDILMVASDDLHPMTPAIDQAVRRDFQEEVGDLDAMLWYSDQNARICCHPVIGKTYYQRDGFVADPRFKAFYVDDLWTITAQRRGKLYRSSSVKWVHSHPNYKNRKPDATDARGKAHMMADYRLFCKIQAGIK